MSRSVPMPCNNTRLESSSQKRRSHSRRHWWCSKRRMNLLLLSVGSMLLLLELASSFVVVPLAPVRHPSHTPPPPPQSLSSTATTTITSATITSTALSLVWSYGGSETLDAVDAADSCELVPVRIERTSANSRRILGEITAPVPLRDVWAILTDYDHLSTHVPNLVESRIVQQQSRGGSPGDGQFQCRLFQRGAQKVFGFEFGASVTMDMREVIVVADDDDDSSLSSSSSAATLEKDGDGEIPTTPTQTTTTTRTPTLGERRITFKCQDSFFFSEFDGAWTAKERLSPDGQYVETLISYVVDVRPKGPVPVAALEWRIKEDVPVNLRSVKRAAMTVGHEGVNALRNPTAAAQVTTQKKNKTAAAKGSLLTEVKVDWYKDETMAAYLKDH